MWSSLSIGKKLFVAIMTTVLMVIAFMAIMIVWSMRAGFNDYVLRAELGRFDDLVAHLAESHDADNPGWPELEGNKRALRDLLSSFNPPSSRNNQNNQGQNKAMRGDDQPQNRATDANQSSGRQSSDRQADGATNAGQKQPEPSKNSKNSPPAPPPPRNAENRKPPKIDPLNLAGRLALYKADGTLLVGPDIAFKDTTARIIARPQADGDVQVLGYLGMAKPNSRVGGPQVTTGLFFEDQLQKLVFVVLLALTLSAIAAYLLSRQFTRPVNELLSGAKQLTHGAYDFRLRQNRGDEFGRLVTQFNLLAAQLERQEKSERQWLSDTSHELQTPIAVLKAEIEAIQDGVRQPDKKTLETLHRAVTRLSALVQDISQLSHAREGRLVTAWAREDLSLLVAEAVEKVKSLADKKGLEMTTELEVNLIAQCDPMRMGQLVDNILTNAIRYTQSPGMIKVQTRSDGADVLIRIDDSNSPPPYDAMEKIFDRFYRVDQSRTRANNEQGGSGLGLAISRLIARAHGGELSAEWSELGGLALMVRFPRQRADGTQERRE